MMAQTLVDTEGKLWAGEYFRQTKNAPANTVTENTRYKNWVRNSSQKEWETFEMASVHQSEHSSLPSNSAGCVNHYLMNCSLPDVDAGIGIVKIYCTVWYRTYLIMCCYCLLTYQFVISLALFLAVVYLSRIRLKWINNNCLHHLKCFAMELNSFINV